MTTRRIITGFVAGLALTACTPTQIAQVEQVTGVTFTAEQRTILLAIPDPLPDAYPYPPVERWHQTAIDTGWGDDWARLACVIDRESDGNPDAHTVGRHDNSFGLTQLNMLAHHTWVGPLVGYDYTRLYDPTTNLTVARHLYTLASDVYGNGWQPWGTCTPQHT